MKRCLQTILLAVSATMVLEQGPLGSARAETPGYASPSFFTGSPDGSGVAPQAMPPLPASPLAGGFPAAEGGAYMDAHGQPIILPASYCQGCPTDGGYGAGCPGGYGDPMAVDFGGYGHDQCGPHYFDVAFETVWLNPDKLFGPEIAPFTSAGIGMAAGVPVNPQLDPSGQESEYEPGWSIAMRYDLGPLSVIEATYMGLYDIGFHQQSISVRDTAGNLDDSLFSVFSQYGFDPAIPIAELDEASIQNLEYFSDLQSTEISYRRYWLGNATPISGTYLLGARYVRMTEELIFSAIAQNGSGSVTFDSENDLVGFQLGGDAWACVRQGLRIGCEGKAGVYNNRFKYVSSTTVTSIDSNFAPPEDGNTVSFVGEGGVSMVADILPSWSLRGGYQIMYLSSIVTVGNNISTTQFAEVPVDQPALATEGHAFYHGFHGGLEYVW
jgi:hypothetical protein